MSNARNRRSLVAPMNTSPEAVGIGPALPLPPTFCRPAGRSSFRPRGVRADLAGIRIDRHQLRPWGRDLPFLNAEDRLSVPPASAGSTCRIPQIVMDCLEVPPALAALSIDGDDRVCVEIGARAIPTPVIGCRTCNHVSFPRSPERGTV